MPRRKARRPEPDRTACVIYARFSSEKQRDESIEDQVRVCSDWAAGHGLTVVATYADHGVLRVEIPWRASENLLETGVSAAQKIGERPAKGQFAEFKFGSPYQIRTGDLRLERVIPQRRLRTTDLYKRASEQVFCSDEQRLTEPDENGVPVAVVSRLCPIYDQATGKFRLKEIAMNHSAADIDAMCALEDYSHFRAELVEISPESFTIEELREILDDMIRSKVALEDSMREHFATLGEAEQTELLDMLGSSGYKDRSWWYWMLMDGPVHREFPTI